MARQEVKTGVKISTTKRSPALVKALLARDSTFAPLTNGGYAIRELKSLSDGTRVLSFEELSCAPARTLLVFVRKKCIYANRAASDIMDILREENIGFFVENKAPLPKSISSFITKKKRA